MTIGYVEAYLQAQFTAGWGLAAVSYLRIF
jgi:hypothetical protein